MRYGRNIFAGPPAGVFCGHRVSARNSGLRHPTYDQSAKAALSEVLNQYKRRTDLIPNLVEIRKGVCHSREDGADGSHEGPRASDKHSIAAGHPDQS